MTDTNATAFIQAHAVSALKLAQKVEVDAGLKALIFGSGNAIHDLLASGNRSVGLTLDGGHVDVAQALSAAPSAAAGYRQNSAGALLA